MKPSQISDILTLAMKARENGDKLNPLFVGAPGIGKSEIIQQWCKANDLPFIDLRAAYLEAPDLIGFPMLQMVNGRHRTVHGTPDFWPDGGKGVLLLEEPNRGTTAVMNTFMQILTDRKVHQYTLPDGWIIVGAINPENEENDVQTMDAALLNRFQPYEVTYDKDAHVKYMMAKEYDSRIIHFVKNLWHYALPESIANNPGAKYTASRNFTALNSALKAGLMEFDAETQMTVIESILGKVYGVQFFNFLTKERPVFVADLLKNPKEALWVLKDFSKPEDYKNGHISMFIEDLKKNESLVDDDTLASVLTVLPADQSAMVLRELGHIRKMKANELFDKMCKGYPAVKKYLQKNLKAEK